MMAYRTPPTVPLHHVHVPPRPMPAPGARRFTCRGCGAPQQRGEKACTYCRLPA
jgi:hypothetical protein